MHTIRLIHWNSTEAEERAAIVRDLGYSVDCAAINNVSLRVLWSDPPQAILIDLSRLPSQGRDLGVTIRKRKATRFVPLIFVGGKPEKIIQVKALLPDAHYTTWDSVANIITYAIQHPVENPIVPSSGMAAYAGTPLPRKLGVKPGSIVGLVDAPPNFAENLGELPAGVSLETESHGNWDLSLWFVRTLTDLVNGIDHILPYAQRDGLWIIWPKNSARKTGLSQTIVRKTGMDAGLVDYKIASIDKTWSGLRFTHKKKG